MAFLGSFLQLILLLFLPVVALGLFVRCAYRLFCVLIGNAGGRGLLTAAHVPFTPVRELAHLLAAVLFGHRVTNFRILRLGAPDGELGFVEHSYRKGNPVAALGNLAVALWPALSVVLVTLLALRLLLPETYGLMAETTVHLGTGLDSGDVVAAVTALFGDLFGNFKSRLVPKLIFLAVAALLCLGAHVTLHDLLHAIGGAIPFGILAAGGLLLVSLFDPRITRVALFGVRWFGVTFAAVHLLLAAMTLALLAFGLFFALLRLLFGLDRRYWRCYYAAQDAAADEAEGADADDPHRINETEEGQLFYKKPPQRSEESEF